MFEIIRKNIKELQYLNIKIIENLKCIKMEMQPPSYMHVIFEADITKDLLSNIEVNNEN